MVLRLLEQRVPILGRIAVVGHPPENSVGVILRALGPQRVPVIHPGMDDDLQPGVIAEEEAKPLAAELGPEPVLPIGPERIRLLELRAAGSDGDDPDREWAAAGHSGRSRPATCGLPQRINSQPTCALNAGLPIRASTAWAGTVMGKRSSLARASSSNSQRRSRCRPRARRDPRRPRRMARQGAAGGAARGGLGGRAARGHQPPRIKLASSSAVSLPARSVPASSASTSSRFSRCSDRICCSMVPSAISRSTVTGLV